MHIEKVDLSEKKGSHSLSYETIKTVQVKNKKIKASVQIVGAKLLQSWEKSEDWVFDYGF